MNRALCFDKRCPSCRIPCSSKRNLRLDSRFDEIVQLFYPNSMDSIALEFNMESQNTNTQLHSCKKEQDLDKKSKKTGLAKTLLKRSCNFLIH